MAPSARGDHEADDLDARLRASQARLAEVENHLAEMQRLHNSTTWRIAGHLNSAGRKVAPAGTRRLQLLRRVARALDPGARRSAPRAEPPPSELAPVVDAAQSADAQYQVWVQHHEPHASRLREMRDEMAGWRALPTVAIILPTGEASASALSDAVASVTAQVYGNWELWPTLDGATRAEAAALITGLVRTDPRIHVTGVDGDVVTTAGAALELTGAEWIMFLDAKDRLTSHALFSALAYLQAHGDADVIYGDDDELTTDGRRVAPRFKPDWSPELLLGTNYIGRNALVARSVLAESGGLRAGYDGIDGHDLLLRVTERARHVGHVPEVMVDRRVAEGTAPGCEQGVGRRAVEDALRRRGLVAAVTQGMSEGYCDVRYRITGAPRVAIVIPTRDRVDLLSACIGLIESKSTYANYEILIIDNDSRDPATLAYLAASKYRVVPYPGPFNYSKITNCGVADTDTDYVILLNNDVEVVSADWIEALLEHGQRDRVGAVGARLLFPDGRVQHEGIGVGLDDHAPANNLDDGRPVVRNVSAVTAACMLVPRAAFNAVGGFDERIGVSYNDVDFCLRLIAAGYDVIYTPHAELIHAESSTRGDLNPAGDHVLFAERWGGPRVFSDPFVSPHLIRVNPMTIRI